MWGGTERFARQAIGMNSREGATGRWSVHTQPSSNDDHTAQKQRLAARSLASTANHDVITSTETARKIHNEIGLESITRSE
jgi:hypothetical protein